VLFANKELSIIDVEILFELKNIADESFA